MNFYGQGFANLLNLLTLAVLCKYAFDTRTLARTSQRQSSIASEALENASRPCVLVISNQKAGAGDIGTEATLKLTNIGSGPALNISWQYENKRRPILANSLGLGGELELGIKTKELINGGGSITCEFESLGGIRYKTETQLITDEGRYSFHLEHRFIKNTFPEEKESASQ